MRLLEMTKIVTKKTKLFELWQKKNLAEVNNNFNYRISDGHIAFPYCNVC